MADLAQVTRSDEADATTEASVRAWLDPRPAPSSPAATSSSGTFKPGSDRLRLTVTEADLQAAFVPAAAAAAAATTPPQCWWQHAPHQPRLRSLLAANGVARRTVTTDGRGEAVPTAVCALLTPAFLEVLAHPLNPVVCQGVTLNARQRALHHTVADGHVGHASDAIRRALAVDWSAMVHVPARALLLVIFQFTVLPDGLPDVRELPALAFQFEGPLFAVAATAAGMPPPPPEVIVPIFAEDVKQLPDPRTMVWAPRFLASPPTLDAFACTQVLWLEPVPSVHEAPATLYWSGLGIGTQ